MTIQRQIIESPFDQGSHEAVAYTLTTTPWGGTPTSIAVALYQEVDGAWTDVSSTKLSGSASAVGDVISTPLVTGLTAQTRYRLEIQFTVSGNDFEAWAIINCSR